MTEPTPIVEVQKYRDEAVVKVLRELLDLAERGEIISFAAAYVSPRHRSGQYLSGHEMPTSMLGSLRILEARVLSEWVDWQALREI